MEKMFLVMIEEYNEITEIREDFYSKKELFDEFFGCFVDLDCDVFVRVENEEHGMELLEEELFEENDLVEFLNNYGSMEKWHEEMEKRISYRLDPRLKVYEVSLIGIKEVSIEELEKER